MKIPALAMGLGAMFLLAACNDDKQDSQANEKGNTVVTSPAPVPAAPAGEKSRLEDARFIQATVPVSTLDGRKLNVTFTAYCEKMEDLDNSGKYTNGNTEYSAACSTYVRNQLNLHARLFSCFEGSIPAVNAAVRNHAGLPQKADDTCYDAYPPNYAPWPEDMMRRTLEMTPDDNLFTVTKIEPLAPG